MPPSQDRATKIGQTGGHNLVKLMRECLVQRQGMWWGVEGWQGHVRAQVWCTSVVRCLKVGLGEGEVCWGAQNAGCSKLSRHAA